jgi:hypothetical protein
MTQHPYLSDNPLIRSAGYTLLVAEGLAFISLFAVFVTIQTVTRKLEILEILL